MSTENECKESLLIDSLKHKIKEYARGRSKNVKRGLETPKLSALLLEKYAWGFSEAVREMNRSVHGKIELINLSDELCLEIDPDFIKNKEKRWEMTPANLNF